MKQVVDRVPTRPNRIKLTSEANGSINYYTWERADEPLVDGTPINKELFDTIDDDFTDVNKMGKPNILVNADFKVNQKGQSSYTSSTAWIYTVDKWQIRSSNTTVSVVTDGINISTTGTIIALAQFIDNVNLKVGQTYSCSASIDGEIIGGSVTYDGTDYTDVNSMPMAVSKNGFIIRLGKLNGTVCFQIRTSSKTSCTVRWAKVEQDDTITTFIPRTYDEELYLCGAVATGGGTDTTVIEIALSDSALTWNTSTDETKWVQVASYDCTSMIGSNDLQKAKMIYLTPIADDTITSFENLGSSGLSLYSTSGNTINLGKRYESNDFNFKVVIVW